VSGTAAGPHGALTAGGVGRRWSQLGSPWWAPPAGIALVIATTLRFGPGVDAAAFAAVQLVLVALAAVDLATRRLPNVITIPTALAAIALRAAFERSELAGAALAGVGALLAFGVLSFALRGGVGMGDVKLAGMLGFVLGSAVVPALVLGILAGGVASIALLATGRASWKSAIAYGPYLALGGAIAILATHPPPLV
jgi:leader peptidase (prepilin peptidase)/N-methyltransferase